MRTLIALFALTFLVACGAEDGERPTKTDRDPGADLVDTGKADFASDYLTTIVGALEFGGEVTADIDWPDWYHGYTVEVPEGSVVHFQVLADAAHVSAVYGPAIGEKDGRPLFARPISIERARGNSFAIHEYSLAEAGTYMLVLGPTRTWEAKYTVKVGCVGGACLPDAACESDDACDAGEFCGHNGVVCVRAPCEASFNVCQPSGDVGQFCDRNAMCGGGLGCIGGTCVALEGGCFEDADCADGFCGCLDGNCDTMACKDWQAEGESCGGFVRPDHIRRCAPGNDCVTDPRIPDIHGTCALRADVAEVIANPASFEGRTVALEGTIDHGYAICTQQACSRENMCCNSCGAEQQLFPEGGDAMSGAEGLSLQRGEEHFGCGGNNCNYNDNCTVEDGDYTIIGKVTQPSQWATVIEISNMWEKGAR